MPAAESLVGACLPLGLAHDVRLKRDLAAGAPVTWDDVDADESSIAVKTRREMEAMFGDAQ